MLCASIASGAPVPETPPPIGAIHIPGLVTAPFPLHIALKNGSRITLAGMVVRPDRPGRFPLALLTHGRPRDFAETKAWTPTILIRPAIALAQRGYAAVAFLRRGFGDSEGPYVEGEGPCDARDYLGGAQASADDVLAVLAILRNEPWVDPARVLLVGGSAGGVAVIAATARDPSGIVGILSFAGGRGSVNANVVCQPERLLQMWQTFGRSVRVPSLWIFAANDQYFGPEIARRMFNSYTSAGAPAKFISMPAFGSDGHMLLYLAPPRTWWPPVGAFLDGIHLPTRIIVDLPLDLQRRLNP